MRDFELLARVKCPYCGYIDSVCGVPSAYGKSHVCDSENGGCDQPYWITIKERVVIMGACHYRHEIDVLTHTIGEGVVGVKISEDIYK